MSKKWEKAQPVVLDYLDNNPNCYLNDIVDALNLSAYVISTALKKAGRYNEINLGLSPKKKLVRDAKLSQIISEKYAKGEINKCEYDDNWKEKVKPPLFSYNMTLYRVNPKTSIKKLLELVSKLRCIVVNEWTHFII